MTRLKSLIKEVLSQEPPYYIIQSLKTGSPKYIFSIEGEKPSWVSDNRIEQAHRFATLEDAKNYLSKFDTKRTEFWHIYKRPSGDIGLGPDLKESKKDCNCGCGGCDKKSPIITEGRIKKAISEGLTYHVENKIPLHESVYRIGSEKHFELINEARKLWVRGLIDVSEDDQAILETNLGHFGMYEGEKVPLDLPMVNEDEINEVEIGDRVKIDKNYGGGRGIVDDKVGGYVIINGKSYHESDVKVINPVNEANLDDELKSKRKKIELEYGPRTYRALQIALMKGEDGKVAKILDTLNEENKPSRIDSLIKLVKSAKNPRNLPISFGTTSVAIGGTQYDKGELVDMFNGRELGMDSMDIRKVFYNAQQDAEAIADEINASNSGIEATIGYGYGKRPILYLKKSSLNEVHKLLRQTNLSSEEYQKAKKLKGFNADDYTFSSDNNLYVKKESVDEVDRYSGFLRNPEDPDSEPFNPTGAVAEFKEELRALFGKFKGDLKNPEFIKGVAEIMVNWKALLRSQLDEAKKKKKKKKKDPPLNKPRRGGSKAYYVYVRDPKTKKVKKVSFGSGGLRAKIKNKDARNAFAARHNCKNKKDRTKAGYWSCNLPRYAEQLGLGSNMNTFW